MRHGDRRRQGPRRPVALLAIAVCVIAGCSPDTAGRRTSAAAGGGTLRVVINEPAFQGFDPHASYTRSQFELLRCCLVRTLMTYRGVPDFAGTQPVPDLASGPPAVSTDGKVWTFRLRRGIHYAPPLEDVEVTAADIVRALLRAGSDHAIGGPGSVYLTSIEGFAEYAAGDAAAIAGVSTPDDHTIMIRQIRADRSMAHLFALPFTAPIPPSPADPEAPMGVAEGHPFAAVFDRRYEGPPTEEGYGPFLVASGPYMVEGAEELDFTRPPDEQEPPKGLSLGWWFGDPGSVVLVRNPSWDAATDPHRPAIADRIEISIVPQEKPYPALEAGDVDVIMGESPPPAVLHAYRDSDTLRDLVVVSAGNSSRFMTMNLAQPPFDDIHVRRAVALAMDRVALRGPDSESIASHVVPDPMVGSLLSSWNPFPSAGVTPDPVSARAEMDASRYGAGGRCADPVCRHVLVQPPIGASAATIEAIRDGLASIGIGADIRDNDIGCVDPRERVALCVTGWIADFPDAGNMFVPFLPDRGYNPTLLGSSPMELTRWGYDQTQRLPSVEADYQRCSTTSGVEAALCWARLDQLLTGQLVAIVPISTAEVVRLRGAGVEGFSLDQAFGEPSLDRITPPA